MMTAQRKLIRSRIVQIVATAASPFQQSSRQKNSYSKYLPTVLPSANVETTEFETQPILPLFFRIPFPFPTASAAPNALRLTNICKLKRYFLAENNRNFFLAKKQHFSVHLFKFFHPFSHSRFHFQRQGEGHSVRRICALMFLPLAVHLTMTTINLFDPFPFCSAGCCCCSCEVRLQ